MFKEYKLMKKFNILIFILCCTLLQGCGQLENPDNGRLVYDLVCLSRQHLASAIFLFSGGETHYPRSLSSFYYTFFSLQRLNYFKKAGKETEDKIPHANIWENSYSKLKVRKAFGRNGLLKIRHRWDYFNSPHSVTNLRLDVDFLLSETSVPASILIDDTKEAIERILVDCNTIGNCNYRCEEFCYRIKSIDDLNDLKSRYFSFIDCNRIS